MVYQGCGRHGRRWRPALGIQAIRRDGLAIQATPASPYTWRRADLYIRHVSPLAIRLKAVAIISEVFVF